MAHRSIAELTTDEELREAFPVMRQLRPAVDEGTYLDRVRAAQADGYRLFALREGGTVVALAGLVVRTNLFDGRFAWVDDLVTDRERRSEGHGEYLLEAVAAWAREQGCETIALASGLQRSDAHRFYEERVDMEATSYVFKRDLE